jgi:hypothetical protein
MPNEILPNQEEEINTSSQQNDAQQLTKQERRRLKNELMREKKQAGRLRQQRQKVMKRSVWILISAGLLTGFFFLISSKKILPPTTIQGHIESSPESHILDQPMDVRVHKHMLEHADGVGPSGIIINHNCEDYDCEPDLIDRLSKFVEENPETVYLAPYPNMSAKIVLSALGRQEILDSFDEQVIRNFIEQ